MRSWNFNTHSCSQHWHEKKNIPAVSSSATSLSLIFPCYHLILIWNMIVFNRLRRRYQFPVDEFGTSGAAAPSPASAQTVDMHRSQPLPRIRTFLNWFYSCFTCLIIIVNILTAKLHRCWCCGCSRQQYRYGKLQHKYGYGSTVIFISQNGNGKVWKNNKHKQHAGY